MYLTAFSVHVKFKFKYLFRTIVRLFFLSLSLYYYFNFINFYCCVMLNIETDRERGKKVKKNKYG